MEGFFRDLRFGWRTLRRNPGFALIAVLTLALGIGANVAMLSVASALLLRQLPYEDPDRVMLFWEEDRKLPGRGPFSIPTFHDIQERNRVFERVAMFSTCNLNLVESQGEPERLDGLMVSAEFLQAVGVEPILGRGFLPEEDRLGAARTVILSNELWQRRFGNDPGVLGRTLRLDGDQYTVIAVLPPGLGEERLLGLPFGDLWLPMGVFFDQLPVEIRADHPGLVGVGRLRPEVSMAAARGDLMRIADELSAEYPLTDQDLRLAGTSIREETLRDVRPTVLVLLAAIGFILLIACANLLHLVLTRATLRNQELATRSAVGASRGRLIRQLLTECLLLGLLGGVAGLLAASQVLHLVPRVLTGIAHVEEARIDASIVAATAGLSLVTSLLIGLIPALQATRSSRQQDLATHLGNRTRAMPRQRLVRQALVAFELAVTLLSLIGAGLMLGTLARLRAQDPGFEAARLLTLKVDLPRSDYGELSAWMAFFDEALDRVKALPGVDEVAITSAPPMSPDIITSPAVAGDRPLPLVSQMLSAIFQATSPGYFRVMGMPLLAGRDFDLGDDDRRDAQRVVVVSESLADALWPEEDPIGKSLAFEFRGTPAEPEPQWRRIVGVVGDARLISLREPPLFAVYVPYTQRPLWFESGSAAASPMTLVVRPRGKPLDLVAPILSRLREIDSQLPVFNVRTMSDVLASQLDQPRMVSSLLAALAALALVLAMIGVYGVISYSVASRTREIGVRMAFGADPGQILGMVLRQSLVPVAIGIVIGLIAASSLTHLMSSLIYGVQAIDPVIFLSVAAILTAAAIAAAMVPAWRAMKVQPSAALHFE